MSEQQTPRNDYLKPRERIEQLHAAFDRELEQILEELEVWNFRIATAYDEDGSTGETTHLTVAQAAKNELDEQWSYYGDWIMISGAWDVNRPDLTDGGIIYNESSDEPVFSAAVSNGFELDIKDNAPPVVGFSFKVGFAALANKKIHGTLEYLAFARPERASFSLARLSSEFETPKEQLVDAVRFYDGLLKLYTHEPSDFYRKSAAMQQKFFNNIISDLSDIVTAPPYVTLCSYAEVPYLYRRGKQETADTRGLSLEYVQDDSDIILSGPVKGITILDSLYATDTPLKSIDDLIDSEAGICFIMSPSEGSMDDDEIDERDLIVPARLIKDLDIAMK